ncbi:MULTISPECIES: tetrahydrodipicolinate N-succinyltransferase N-terminal domain-containing protein [unclassified Helicobacter]|uniref:tetrahydrodipicolinate N-succinyltransferase N-terminal domain-containing protein n=1 Tax=unclassified Helicobacter TaxID=2593540 RepID=UPI000CF05676|nr:MULTISPECIES: tetrahydrodipicolinate N-succinyltransferase N-terminal domain-containing protein [unclassified Helicobacter]
MENFKQFVQNHQSNARKILGFGIARIDLGRNQKVLCATYPVLNWDENFGSYAVFDTCKQYAKNIQKHENEEVYLITEDFINNALELFSPFLAEANTNTQSHKNIQVLLQLKKILQKPIQHNTSYHLVFLYNDLECKSVETAYMKLLALSLGKAKLRSLNLNGIFGLLSNVAWSGNKPYELDYLRENEIELKLKGEYPHIDFVDKFPRYLMQVIPQYDNIRLLDTAKTRFGAYLGKGGYTQMPGASYINFNAGVEGACMNEGRISSSVVVGEGSDVGGGASILGVLSGGNTDPISIGKNCLLGVNSSTGISLGDGCIVDGGIAVLSGTVFEISPEEAKKLQEINPDFKINEDNLYKGRELSKVNGVHFRQNSKNGKMIAFRSNREIALNKDLH